MKSKKILITGGAGFLGTHLLHALIEKGFHDITVIDQFKPQEKALDGIKYVFSDFGNEETVRPLLSDCNCLFHLAAMVGVDNCVDHPDQVQKVNLVDTKKLIDWTIEASVGQIIFTSSSEVYGNSRSIPYKEGSKLEPVSDYGRAKVEIESYLKEKQKNSRTSVGIARPFNVYGPHQKRNFVVPIFIYEAMNNRPLEIFGDGNQTRCFTYVRDITEGLVKLSEYDKSQFEIFNLGRSEECSMNHLAKKVLSFFPESVSEVTHLSYGINGVRAQDLEIDRRVPSVEKAKELLGFEAKTSLDEGISEIIREEASLIGEGKNAHSISEALS